MVAENGKSLVGFAISDLKEHRAFYADRKYVELVELFVLNEFRKRGVATAFIRKTFAWARRNGANHIDLEAWSGNEPALEFYAKMGFKEKRKVMTRKI